MNKKWVFHHPEFACDELEPVLLPYGPWAGLRTFGYDLLCWLQPEVMVELGCHYGCSSFAFLQALSDHLPDTSYYGVDTWQGDAFTWHDYEDDVYEAFTRVLDRCYAKTEATILPMTFHEAAALFPEESIDLLHLDGCHLYEDVKRDFEEWLPRVRRTGAILLHDTADYLTFQGKRLGSSLFWEELKEKYPWHAELPISCGLGILFLDQRTYKAFTQCFDPAVYQREEYMRQEDAKAKVREMSFLLREVQKERPANARRKRKKPKQTENTIKQSPGEQPGQEAGKQVERAGSKQLIQEAGEQAEQTRREQPGQEAGEQVERAGSKQLIQEAGGNSRQAVRE